MIAADAIVDEGLQQVASLGNTELAIVGAALELGASEVRPIDPALLLTHARRTFRSEDDLLSALASLERSGPVSYTHLRAHETVLDLVCRLLLETKNK